MFQVSRMQIHKYKNNIYHKSYLDMTYPNIKKSKNSKNNLTLPQRSLKLIKLYIRIPNYSLTSDPTHFSYLCMCVVICFCASNVTFSFVHVCGYARGYVLVCKHA